MSTASKRCLVHLGCSNTSNSSNRSSKNKSSNNSNSSSSSKNNIEMILREGHF